MAKGILDPTAITLKPVKSGKSSRQHRAVLQRLIYFIHNAYDCPINYDHIDVAVPRSNLPLKFRGKNYDISFVLDDRLIFIDIQSMPISIKVSERGILHGDWKE